MWRFEESIPRVYALESLKTPNLPSGAEILYATLTVVNTLVFTLTIKYSNQESWLFSMVP